MGAPKAKASTTAASPQLPSPLEVNAKPKAKSAGLTAPTLNSPIVSPGPQPSKLDLSSTAGKSAKQGNNNSARPSPKNSPRSPLNAPKFDKSMEEEIKIPFRTLEDKQGADKMQKADTLQREQELKPENSAAFPSLGGGGNAKAKQPAKQKAKPGPVGSKPKAVVVPVPGPVPSPVEPSDGKDEDTPVLSGWAAKAA